MDQTTKKIMTMQKALHPRDGTDGLYVSRKEGEWELARIEDSVDASTQGLEDYIKKSKETLITATESSISYIKINQQQLQGSAKEGKQSNEYFMRQTEKIPLEKTWTWLR